MRHSNLSTRLPFLLLCFGAALNTKTIFAYEKLVLAVPIFPPYTYIDEQQQLTGSGTTKVKQLLESMGLEYQFRVVANHGVAADLTQKGLVDGFFLATQNQARDQAGVISAAVMYNKWTWFYLHDNPLSPASPHFRAQAKIGTRLNTNTYQWLLDNDHLVAAKTSEASTLITMLTNKRLDAVFLSADVFWHALTEAGVETSLVHHTTQSTQPFSCYFSKEYLARNPGFLEQFNHLAVTAKD
ncbi:substrate-binding periplasmic protein [Rheinheimera hassiensis]|uniref:substrate-binding periplasmic protein n=1 Tax=Rheinheimera hassiensis TaxID=1193627 RepID=UPI001F059F8C|nr:transporter substrate-binding domain-containing protein [Rheinheimera hassiensis]